MPSASSREVSSATRSCAAEAAGSAWSTMRSTSSGARASSAAWAAEMEKRTARCRVAGRERVMSEQGQALGGRVAAGGQHVDDAPCGSRAAARR